MTAISSAGNDQKYGKAYVRRYRGFTLIEIMVVLFIAAAVAGLVAPRFSSALRTMEIRAATREVVAILNTVQTRAVSGAREISLLIDVRERVITADDSDKRYRLPQKLALKVTAAESEQISEDVVGIRFFPDGSSTGGRVELLSANKQSFAIDVDWLTGTTRILD